MEARTENSLWFGTSGPADAEIVLVGEAWGADEAAAQKPFVGMAGRELDRILAEAGLNRNNILLTNVMSARPYNNEMWRFFHAKESGAAELRGLHPTAQALDHVERLTTQLGSYPRRLVIPTGNYPLWALTPHGGVNPSTSESEGRRTPTGIGNWRGSMTYTLGGVQCLPIFHPAAIMRQWSIRAVTVHDLKARVPMALRGDWRPNPAPVFWAPPTFEQAKSRLEFWLRRAQSTPVDLAADIETSKGLITCIGFADSKHFAMCIPWVKKTPTGLDSFWTPAEEAVLVRLIRELFRNPNVRIYGQNFLYDTQYIQSWWGVTPRLDFDTMLAHHLLWPGTPKGLDYLSSLYCQYHWYWKEDGKEWDTKGTLEQLLLYNCIDCIRTWECGVTLRQLIPQLGQARQWEETKARTSLALRMMNRGVRIDRERKGRLSVELAEVLSKIDAQLLRIIPQSWLPPHKKGAKKTPWYSSPKQQLSLFVDLLGMRVPKHRKTGNLTMGKDAIPELKKRHPEFTGLFERLEQRRSVAVFKSHFADARLDPDGRMRCFFNPAGTGTFRFSSSANAFGRGTNLQNIPTGDEE